MSSGSGLRGLVWVAALGLSFAALAKTLTPTSTKPPAMKELEPWASLLGVPQVSLDLSGSEETKVAGVRRILLDVSRDKGMQDVSPFQNGATAYIDGVATRFQTYEPESFNNPRGVVFSRTRDGRSLFFACAPKAPCRTLHLFADRARLNWTLRFIRMSPRNAFLFLLALAGLTGAAFRLRHSWTAALASLGLAFGLAFRAPDFGQTLTWSDIPALGAAALLLTRRAIVLDLGAWGRLLVRAGMLDATRRFRALG